MDQRKSPKRSGVVSNERSSESRLQLFSTWPSIHSISKVFFFLFFPLLKFPSWFSFLFVCNFFWRCETGWWTDASTGASTGCSVLISHSRRPLPSSLAQRNSRWIDLTWESKMEKIIKNGPLINCVVLLSGCIKYGQKESKSKTKKNCLIRRPHRSLEAVVYLKRSEGLATGSSRRHRCKRSQRRERQSQKAKL